MLLKNESFSILYLNGCIGKIKAGEKVIIEAEVESNIGEEISKEEYEQSINGYSAYDIYNNR